MDQILVSVCCPPQNEHIAIKKVANSHVGVILKNVEMPKKFACTPLHTSSSHCSRQFRRNYSADNVIVNILLLEPLCCVDVSFGVSLIWYAI